jgi:hypothetical protein
MRPRASSARDSSRLIAWNRVVVNVPAVWCGGVGTELRRLRPQVSPLSSESSRSPAFKRHSDRCALNPRLTR